MVNTAMRRTWDFLMAKTGQSSDMSAPNSDHIVVCFYNGSLSEGAKMVAAILIVGVASGTFAAFASMMLLNAPVAVAVFAYLFFGVLGTMVTILALAARGMQGDSLASDFDSAQAGGGALSLSKN